MFHTITVRERSELSNSEQAVMPDSWPVFSRRVKLSLTLIESRPFDLRRQGWGLFVRTRGTVTNEQRNITWEVNKACNIRAWYEKHKNALKNPTVMALSRLIWQ